MFRFINSGLKPSVITFPNSICHSPNLRKKVNDEDNENKKISIVSNKVFIYRNVPHKPYYMYLQNLNLSIGRYLIIPYYHHQTQLRILSIENHLYSNFLQKASVFSLSKLVINFQDSTYDEKDCTEERKSEKFCLTDDSVEKNKTDACKSNENNINRDTNEELLDKFNRLGHELNVKGCDTVTKLDKSTALQYWKCAAAINYPPAQFNLGAYYQSNNDLNTAEQWYRLAVKSGDHPIAAYNLALLLNDKENDCLKDEIRDLLTLSADQGCKEAMNCIECINGSQ